MPCDYCDCHFVAGRSRNPLPGAGTSNDPYVIDACKLMEECGCVPSLRRVGRSLIFEDGHGGRTEIDLSDMIPEIPEASAPSRIVPLSGGRYQHINGDGTETIIETRDS